MNVIARSRDRPPAPSTLPARSAPDDPAAELARERAIRRASWIVVTSLGLVGGSAPLVAIVSAWGAAGRAAP